MRNPVLFGTNSGNRPAGESGSIRHPFRRNLSATRFPTAKFTEYTEDHDGNLYLLGAVENRTGIIIKIGSGGTSIYRADTSLCGEYDGRIVIVKGELYECGNALVSDSGI